MIPYPYPFMRTIYNLNTTLRSVVVVCLAAVSLLSVATAVQGQSERARARSASPAADRLYAVLPHDVARRILERIALAQSQGLPASALEQRALKFAAKGVQPSAIEHAVFQHADRMLLAQRSLRDSRGRSPRGDEIDAAAEVLRKGINRSQLSTLARSAASGRSLTVPLYVISGLLDRGLPADDALDRVQRRLRDRASDSDIERLVDDLSNQPVAQGNRGVGQGKVKDKGKGVSRRPPQAGERGNPGVGRGNGGNPPRGVPANPGKGKGKGGKPNPGRG